MPVNLCVGRRSLYWTRRKTCNHGTNYWRIPRNPYRKIWSPARSRILHGRWHIRGKYKFWISHFLVFWILINKLTCLFYFMIHISFFRSCKRQNDWPLKHHKIIFERLKLLVLQISKSIQFLHYVTIQTCKNRNGYNCQFFRQLKFSNAFTETNSKTLIA